MDLSILGSIATFIVAIITLYNVWHLRRQLKLMEKQVVLQRSEVYPFLEINQKEVKGNEVRLMLINKGGGPAFRIGLKTQFTPLRVVDSRWSFVDKLYEYGDGNEKQIYPGSHVVFLKNSKKKSRLHSQEEDSFIGTPLFMHSYSKSQWVPLKYHTFEDLRNLFASNKLRFSAIGLTLVYLDISESITEQEPLYFFVIDFEKHNSIEEAIKDKIPLPPHTVDLGEVGHIDWKTYKSLKSERAFPESPFED